MNKKFNITIILLVLFVALFIPAKQLSAAPKLSAKAITMVKGQTKQIKLKGISKRPTWSCSNKKIVKVSRKGKYSAKITAKKKGTAYIYAKINKKKYKCKIKVEVPSINRQKVVLDEGKTFQLKIKKTKQKITYESVNPSIATVNATGLVTAISAGNTTITATLACGMQYSCSITVQAIANGEPSAETASVDAGEYSIGVKHTGDGTYYSGGYVGGCCNLDAIASNYYVAAINKIDYRAGHLAGAYLKVTGPNGTVNVLVTDTLADGEGKKGDIDLNQDAFAQIEPLVTGRMTITWEIIPLPTDQPIQYVYKTTSTEYWMEVQVRNHRYPIKKLEILNSAGNYVELERQEYNFFKMDNPGKGPYTFRVTDIYNHTLIDSNIALSPTTPINGAANFPY